MVLRLMVLVIIEVLVHLLHLVVTTTQYVVECICQDITDLNKLQL